jgi:hypothetical protein
MKEVLENLPPCGTSVAPPEGAGVTESNDLKLICFVQL